MFCIGLRIWNPWLSAAPFQDDHITGDRFPFRCLHFLLVSLLFPFGECFASAVSRAPMRSNPVGRQDGRLASRFGCFSREFSNIGNGRIHLTHIKVKLFNRGSEKCQPLWQRGQRESNSGDVGFLHCCWIIFRMVLVAFVGPIFFSREMQTTRFLLRHGEVWKHPKLSGCGFKC